MFVWIRAGGFIKRSCREEVVAGLTSLHQCAFMRTTLNLSEEAHGMALSFARDQRISLSEAVNRLLLQPASHTSKPRKKRTTGIPTFDCIRKVGSQDVRQLEDDL